MSSADFFWKLQASCTATTPKRVVLQAGEALFHQGCSPLGLIMVVSGKLDMVRWTDGGRDVRIHTAKQGETFAEASLFAEACHCDAIARAASEVRILRRSDVLAVFAERPDLLGSFSAYLAQSLMNARRLLELRAIKPLSEGVLARLTEVVDTGGDLPVGTALLSLADDLGVTGPAVYRALAQLEKEGRIIRPARGRVRLALLEIGAPTKEITTPREYFRSMDRSKQG